MTNSEIDQILLELYALDPELKKHEAAIRRLLTTASDLKPDTKFDPKFAARLKERIMQEISRNKSPQPQNETVFKLNFMNKKIYWTTGSLALTAVLIIMIANLTDLGGGSPKNAWPARTISQLPDGAFGNLASISGSQETVASGLGSATPANLGGGAFSGRALATESTDAAQTSVAPMAEGDAQADKMMILPYYGYRYEYVGDDLNLTESEGAVYRRIKGDGQSGRILAGLVSGLNFPDVNLSSFANLRATNLSLMEDKNLGLMITLDFNEDAVFISENWEKWRIMERENCGGDQACWDKWRIKIEDVPADNSLVAKANSFLSRHRINLDNYGDPIVDNNWREMYVQSPDKNNFYIPEYASVVYPLMINEKPVRDQSGSFSGLRVTINLLHDAVSGLSGLSPFRYESSLYKLEDNAKNILAAAEKGGWNRGWFNGSENIRTLQLGTPEKSLVQIWHYKNGRHNELMVPALVFPVLNQPEDGTYYGSKFVTVPLVAEMLQEMNDEQNNLPLPVDLPSTVMPMIKNEVLPVSDETEKFSSEIQPETMPMLPTEAR